MRGKFGKGLEDELEEDTSDGEMDVFVSNERIRMHMGLVQAMDQPKQVKAVSMSRQKLQELQWRDKSLQEPRARASFTEYSEEKEFF